MPELRAFTSDKPLLTGVFPVLVTPFQVDGRPSLEDFDRVIDFNLGAGIDGLVFPGNASEVGTLSFSERAVLIERLCERVGGRVPVVVGLSAADQDVSLAAARHAKSLQVAAAMIAPSVADKNDTNILRRCLSLLGEAVGVPLILQNAPPPRGPGLNTRQVAELVSDLPSIAYVKEECLPAGQRISSHLANASTELRGVFGGAAGRFVMDELARGAIGTMPSCEIPEAHVSLVKAFRAGDVALARRTYNRMVPLLMFTSVFKAAGVKAVLRMRGVIESELCRDPPSGLDAMDHRELGAILEAMGIGMAAEAVVGDADRQSTRSNAR